MTKRVQPHLIWKPFPSHLLPEPLASYAEESAASIHCDVSMVAVAMLSALSAAVGNRATICVKYGWFEPAVIWSAVVSPSGSTKSPAINAGLAPLNHVMSALRESLQEDQARYEADGQEWQARTGGKAKPDDPEPQPPELRRLMTNDATIEALIDLLNRNPAGLLMHRDELAGWLKDLCGPYKAKGGSDKETWLSMFRAEPIEVDRKTSAPLYVPRAFVSVIGTIQPNILNSHLTPANLDSGLAARILFVWPPDRPKRWSDRSVTDSIRDNVNDLFEWLVSLPCPSKPMVVKLDREARELAKEFVNRHGLEAYESEGDIRAALAKLEAYVFRFALLFHFVETYWQIRHDPDFDAANHEWTVSRGTLANAIELVEWFKYETQRVYQDLKYGCEVSDLYHFILKEHEGRITARVLAQRKNRYRGAGNAQEALEELVKVGLARWDTEATKGRPKSLCILIQSDGSP